MKKIIAVGFCLSFAAPVLADDANSGSADLGAALAMDNPSGGGSIRAKKEPDMAAQQRKADKKNVQARIVAVKRGAFPQVALMIKVSKVADDGPGKDQVKKDDEVIVVPAYKMAGKAVDWTDKPTVIAAGAYYLSEGDNVYVRLDALSGKSWSSGYIERR